MDANRKYIFITHWKMADWGFYRRRNEALVWELSRRDCVENVLHIENISLRGVVNRVKQWLTTKDDSFRKTFALHIKKGFSLKPVCLPEHKKVYVFSILELYTGESHLLRKLSNACKKLQYDAINKFLGNTSSKIVFIAYPPSAQLMESVQMIKHELLVADLVDDDVERTFDIAKKDLRMNIYKEVLPKCKWIFSTSPTLNEKYGVFAQQAIDFLPNGVDAMSFSAIRQTALRSERNRKVAGYVGAINNSMDMELLEHLLTQFPGVDFVFIGLCYKMQSGRIADLMERYPNFRFLGMRNYRDVPRIVSEFDVLISLKKNDHTTSGGDSMKIYEYLATGKPIVSTTVPPAEKFAEIIYVTDNKEEFAYYLRLALEEKDEHKRNLRIAASLDNDWSKRVDVILDKVAGLV